MINALCSGLGEQLSKDCFRLLVITFAKLMMPNMPARIDKVERWPIFVIEGAPDRKVIIDDDRIINYPVLYGPANIVDALFKFKLRRLDSDDNQSLVLVFRGPRAQKRKYPN